MDAKKVRGFFKAIRQCMAADLLSGDAMIGGPGQIVEIDESKFGKRKYHCGRRVVGKWVLGGVTRVELLVEGRVYSSCSPSGD